LGTGPQGAGVWADNCVAMNKAVKSKVPHRLPRGGGKPNLMRLLVFIFRIVFLQRYNFFGEKKKNDIL